MCGPLNATTSAISRCWALSCWYCPAVTVALWCQRKVSRACSTNSSASFSLRPPWVSARSMRARAVGVKIERLSSTDWAKARSSRSSISSRRNSEVNTRNGLTCSDASCTARKAVECTGTPAGVRS
ncbi:hypothetical protein D3C81_1456480 [compost metagenome]